jgi:proline racemase
VKILLTFPDGTETEAETLKAGRVAVHAALGGEGYVLTDVSSLKVYCWMKKKGEAVKLRRRLEDAIDAGEDLEALLFTPSP